MTQGVNKPLLTMLTFHIRAPVQERLFCFQSGFLQKCLGKQHIMAHVCGPLPPMWETGSAPAAEGIEEVNSTCKICLFFSIYIPEFFKRLTKNEFCEKQSLDIQKFSTQINILNSIFSSGVMMS